MVCQSSSAGQVGGDGKGISSMFGEISVLVILDFSQDPGGFSSSVPLAGVPQQPLL